MRQQRVFTAEGMEPNTIARRRPYTILFVDDEQAILNAIERLTFDSDANCLFYESPLKALEKLRKDPVDIIVSDLNMPEMSGVDLLAQVASEYPETIRLAMSGMNEKETVLEAINQGRIWGYITKPWDNEELLGSLEQAIYLRSLILERLMLQRSVSQLSCLNHEGFENFVGDSLAMQCVYQIISRAAPSDASVFITGESGTGKELVAEALHQRSRRSEKPLVTLNCAAIPSELLESEIFGHVKGAFSGAVKDREGLASMADGGSLFLDEISEMDIGLQSKLLRFIQTGSFSKVGSSTMETVDIRFISACNRDPMKAIEEGQLREDLYYRLNVISVDMPPLRDREWDALLLANNFLQSYASKEDKLVVAFDEQSEALIGNYHWPGNVRQLENAVNSAVILCSEQLISAADLNNTLKLPPEELESLTRRSMGAKPPVAAVAAIPPHSPANIDAHIDGNGAETAVLNPSRTRTDVPKPLSEVEREAVEQALAHCDQNVARAAALLEVSPSTLYRKLQQWSD
ncbi:sigma-54-dependent transcriptional regulator [Pseudoteredinibacter isoporae]|uniref:Two-component system repressor protein LuxO n=1 Tax=Pseudoteredinibacter isoporae TaxID=570281 RepID=A0A7X0JVK6_9GAMM|nr:sigma-54 dependent transcriptional regulator [Pseudoteredinibacter isoporae]MBB6523070.1 two-component system repressor protein LuxO [Pseudoteredinibacter isoporae]